MSLTVGLPNGMVATTYRNSAGGTARTPASDIRGRVVQAKRLTRRRLGSVSVVLGVGVIAAGILGSPGRPAHGRPHVRLASASSAPILTAPTSPEVQSAAQTFGVFRQVASPADALPAASAYKVGTARRIATSSSGGPSAWAVLTGEQICVTVDASGGPAQGGPAACNTVGELSQPHQLLTLDASSGASGSGSPQIIAGLVPDGIKTVTIDFKDGSSTVAPVNNNGFTYITTNGEDPSGFEWNVNGAASSEMIGVG